MEIVQIPLSALLESIAYFEKAKEGYVANSEMREWADGNLKAYRRILESYSPTKI